MTASSTPAKSIQASSTSQASKQTKQTNILRLKLSATLLTRFPHEKPVRKSSIPKSSSSSTPTSISHNGSCLKNEIKADPISTLAAPSPDASQPTLDAGKENNAAGTKTGVKRERGPDTDPLSKSRARPGPKKRKLDNGTVENGDGPKRGAPGSAPAAAHKLGPKANTGAINAGLRALDRSGKPCRKWQKLGFRVKSFTGVTWQLPSWHAPLTKSVDVTVADDVNAIKSSSNGKANPSSSNLESEKSNSGDIDQCNATSSLLAPIATPA